MSTSTNGEICYGILFEEGYEFPWNDGEMIEWWEDKPNSSSSLPFELVNYCHAEVPMYILALSNTVITAQRGHPVEIDPAKLVVTQQDHDDLVRFCVDHGLNIGEGPKWWLSSYWD